MLQHLVSCALSKLQSGLLLPKPFVPLCVLIAIPLPHVLEQKLQLDHLQAIEQKCKNVAFTKYENPSICLVFDCVPTQSFSKVRREMI